ncbi:FYRN-domain-containing protein, partial [Hygrophoropsis aurantiaca]
MYHDVQKVTDQMKIWLADTLGEKGRRKTAGVSCVGVFELGWKGCLLRACFHHLQRLFFYFSHQHQMSRRRSISTAMGPPPDRDIIMGPPPPPLPSAQQPIQQTSKDNQEITEKYRKLKRRYFELEDKYKETQAELHRSGERNVKMREERELILSRIHELETHSEPNALGVPCPPSSAFPRALLSSRAQSAFVANLRQAMIEDETDDHDADPLLTSRHIGPLARKRAEDEHRERVEEEARENRRAARRPRGGPAKGKEAVGQHTPPGQPLMTYAPSAPHQSGPNAPPPVLVSKQGTRLRIKPPVPPSSAEPGPSAHPSNSQSSLSPLLSPQEEHYDPVHHSANGNHHQQSEFTPPQPGPSPSLPPQTSPVASASTSRQSAKPKRLKAHTVTQKNYSIPTVPRDKKGRPLLPLNVGIMTVVNLGEVCMREHFHTERYIFPVGYEVTRRYLSTIDATAEVVYHCSIVDGGDGPKFQIVASDVPDRPIIAGTATGAWSTIVKQANSIRNRQHSNSVSGPDFFGLGQNTIKHLIQELPGANRLRDYVWQIFVEGG